MADQAHSTTTITGGHANAVAAGAAGFLSGSDKSKLDGISSGADVTSAALVTAGTTTADVAAAALAKVGAYTQIARGTLALGTGAVLSLTDASFAGKVAGGRGDLQGASGVLGIVAGSFASSGAETGTGANQAGLGSAAASGQPYNSTDFPGQNQYAQCVVLTADRKPITLVQMLAGTITDATSEVYGYLSYRSDLGANAKWRLRFYYRRAADGLEASFTPTVSLANCWLEVPEIFLDSTLAPGAGLSQTTAGPAVSPIPTLDQIPAPVAAVSLNSQELTLLAAPTAASSATRRADVDAVSIKVKAMYTVALPANTYNNGTAGVGRTITANANGALPNADGIALSVGDSFFYQCGTIENGVWVVVSAGSGGSAWSAIGHTSLDTSTKIVGSTILVQQGVRRVAGVYKYKAFTTPTMGTTPLFWPRADAGMGPDEGINALDDCCNQSMTLNTSIGPIPLQLFSSTGTAAAGTTNDANTVGVYSFTTNSGSTSIIGLSEIGSGAAASGGHVIGANEDLEYEFKFESPVASDGTNRFALNVGLAGTMSASQKIPNNGVLLVFDGTSGVSSTNWLAVSANGGVTTGTVTDTGVLYAAATWWWGKIVRDAGDTAARIYMKTGAADYALVATYSTNFPTAAVGIVCSLFKNLGTGLTNGLAVDVVSKRHRWPQGRS